MKCYAEMIQVCNVPNDVLHKSSVLTQQVNLVKLFTKRIVIL